MMHHGTTWPTTDSCCACPTYDERENLESMIEALGAVRERTPVPGDVLVIDDNSPDGTGAIADRLADDRPWLHVLHRPRKEGLGRAYLAGFRWALDARLRVRARDGLRLLARSRVGSLAARRGDRRSRPRARLPLRRRRRRRGLGAQPPRDLGRRLPLRARDPRGAGARPHRRLQVLPACRARAHPARRRRRAGLHVPDRDDLPRDPRRLHRRRRCRSRSPTAGSGARRCRAGSCSRPCGASPSCGSGRCEASSSACYPRAACDAWRS